MERFHCIASGQEIEGVRRRLRPERTILVEPDRLPFVGGPGGDLLVFQAALHETCPLLADRLLCFNESTLALVLTLATMVSTKTSRYLARSRSTQPLARAPPCSTIPTRYCFSPFDSTVCH